MNWFTLIRYTDMLIYSGVFKLQAGSEASLASQTTQSRGSNRTGSLHSLGGDDVIKDYNGQIVPRLVVNRASFDKEVISFWNQEYVNIIFRVRGLKNLSSSTSLLYCWESVLYFSSVKTEFVGTEDVTSTMLAAIFESDTGLALAIGRTGDCLGPRALRRGLYNCNIPYTPARQFTSQDWQQLLASLFIGYSWIITHLVLNQLMLQFQCGSRLLNVCVTNVFFRCCELCDAKG